MPGGQRRGGSGDADAAVAARVLELERTVRALAATGIHSHGASTRGAAGGGGQGPRRGADRGGGDGAAAEQPRAGGGAGTARPGDWACPSCAFFPCFARAQRCFRCKEPRHGGQGGGAGGGGGSARNSAAPGRVSGQRSTDAYLGPIGAGGSRPMLGRRAQPPSTIGDGCPSSRVPGASLAARAEEERRRAQTTTASTIDSDGFQQVRHGTSAGCRTGSTAAERAGESHGHRQPTPVRNSWAALSEEDGMDVVEEGDGNDGDQVERACEGADGGDDGRRDDDAAHGPCDDVQGRGDGDEGQAAGDAGRDGADAAQLRREWQALCSAARALDQQRAPPSLLAAARAQRDAAEAKWRAAKAPQPLSKRLRWAESELKDAESRERQHRVELQRHLEEADKKTKELRDRLDADVARTARKRALIAALHAEGAQQPEHRPMWTVDKAATMAATGLDMDVTPVLEGIIARMGSPGGCDTDAVRRELELCAISVGRVKEVLREAAPAAGSSLGGGGPARYDIGGDDDATETTRGEGGGGGASNGLSPAATAVPRWTRAAPNQPWKKLVVGTAGSALSPLSPSMEAAEEARRLLRARAEADPTAPAHGGDCAADGGGGNGGRTGVDGGTEATVAMAGAGTNDLAEAERRRHLAAQHQVLQVHQRQQEQVDERQRQVEEAQRLLRDERRREELERHQQAIQQAAAARAEQEALERAELLAKLSPQERARAEAAHAEMVAVGSHAFGSQQASEVAGLVHQRAVQEAARGATAAGEESEVEHIMSMSPEEFGRWGQDRQAAGW